MVEIRFTATVTTPDDSNTNAYGEPTSEGHGYSLSQGWVSPEWSAYETHDTREGVTVYCPDVEDEQTLIDWAANLIKDTIGDVELVDGTTFYGSSTVWEFETGNTARLAAHVEGMSAEDVRSVAGRL